MEYDNRSASLGAKIKDARNARIPYILVAGAQEAANGQLAVRSRREGEEPESRGLRLERHACKPDRNSAERKEVESPGGLPLVEPDGAKNAVVQMVVVGRHHLVAITVSNLR